MDNKAIQNSMIIKIDKSDNVAVAVGAEGIKKGADIYGEIIAIDNIPQGHKIALEDINYGDVIMRYGEVIGYAAADIKCGSLISVDMVNLPKAKPLADMETAVKIYGEMEKLDGYTFMGYRNNNGSVGTKNMLGIMTCVQCVEGVIKIAVDRIKQNLLHKYPNVDGIMPINHNYGCGVAIDAKESEIPIRTLRNIADNPNFGGEIMVVALGCEKLQPERLFDGKQIDNLIVLQQEKGFENMVNAIVDMAEKCLVKLNKKKREVCSASNLVVGLQCGGSDALSGITANPAVGFAADLLVRAGASVLFSEVTEVRDGVHLLLPRTIDCETGQRLKDEMEWYDDYLSLSNVDRDANPTPGNKQGGLSNVVEKSLGSIAKSGTSMIVDVLSPGEKVRKKGLIFAATPASDFVCGTCQMASGITMQVFTTGRGTTYGLSLLPVIKVSSRTELKQQWKDLIDVDAGRIATGDVSIEDIGWEIFNLILDTASGRKKVWADYWGIENAICLFNPAPVT